jgi:hypothetical protein
VGMADDDTRASGGRERSMTSPMVDARGNDRRARVTRRARRRRRGDDGVALVEFAIIMPLLFALVFGIIDFGGVFNDWIAMRQGARDGARTAVTGTLPTDTCTIYGTPPNNSVRNLVCLVKDRSDIPENLIRVAIAIEGSGSMSGNAAYAAANTDPALKTSVRVCTMIDVRSFSGFYASILESKVLRTEVQMRIERTVKNADPTQPSTKPDLVNWSENPIAGATWTCNAGAS